MIYEGPMTCQHFLSQLQMTSSVCWVISKEFKRVEDLDLFSHLNELPSAASHHFGGLGCILRRWLWFVAPVCSSDDTHTKRNTSGLICALWFTNLPTKIRSVKEAWSYFTQTTKSVCLWTWACVGLRVTGWHAVYNLFCSRWVHMELEFNQFSHYNDTVDTV